ncbi:hypothetical protein Hanom_Chr06g00542921 [Helianthus anomalus]
MLATFMSLKVLVAENHIEMGKKTEDQDFGSSLFTLFTERKNVVYFSLPHFVLFFTNLLVQPIRMNYSWNRV